MISEKTKAKIIAKLTHQEDVDVIAEEFEVPVALVKEWKKNLKGAELIALESNVHAISHVMAGGVLEDNEAILKIKIEEAAIELAKQTYKRAGSGDMIEAKALQLLADGITKLYACIIMKGKASEDNSNPVSSAFQSLMKD